MDRNDRPSLAQGCHTAEMADEDACFSCNNSERPDLPARERIYIGPGWRVAHAFGTALPGWMVLLPRRHVTALDELTAAEAEELGPLLRAVTWALREVTGCDKTYVALFAEAEGFAHVHFHVIQILTLNCAIPVCSACSARTPTEAFLARQWTR